MPRQRLGQHFLSNPAWRARIAETLPPPAGDTWLEIGPGHGEMTRLLAAPGRRLIAVETDPVLAAGLRQGIASHPAEWPGVEIVEADILHFDFAPLGAETFRVYGNLPYYITSPILHRLFDRAAHIASIHIVIQLEVAARIAARPGCRDYGYLSVACQFFATPRIALRIPPGAFSPPPRVASALVAMTLPGERGALGIADEPAFLRFVQSCFSQKRKTLRNNLRPLASSAELSAVLAACGLRPDARAEQLSLPQFAALFAQLKPGPSAV